MRKEKKKEKERRKTQTKIVKTGKIGILEVVSVWWSRGEGHKNS